MLSSPQLLERPRFASQLEAEAFELCEGGRAKFVPRRQAAFRGCGAVPHCWQVVEGLQGDKEVPLPWEDPGKDPPRARHGSHLPLGEPLVQLRGLDSGVLSHFCSQYLSPTDLH